MNVATQALPTPGIDEAYAAGKLLPGVHSRLVEELPRIAHEAGVTRQDITGQLYSLTEVEKGYLQKFRLAGTTGSLGLIYIGAHTPEVTLRGRSICGALLRNFISARFIPREELIETLFNSHIKTPRADLMVVPDFHYGDAPAATKRALASWLIGRTSRGRQTVLGVPSTKVLREIFGDETDMYLKHFTVSQGINQNSH